MTFEVTMTIPEWREATADELADPVARVIRDEIAAAIQAIPPGPNGHRPFNATGHLVQGLQVVRTGEGSYAIYAPPDRLERPELLERLIELVPLIADPMSSPKVQAAIAKSLETAIRPT